MTFLPAPFIFLLSQTANDGAGKQLSVLMKSVVMFAHPTKLLFS